ncbi:MAG: site-specific integrase [Chloroflexota bacterium]
MLTQYYQSENFVEQARRGPAGSYMDEFAAALWKDGYAELTARRYIRAAQHLIHWVEHQHIPLTKIDEAQLDRFKRHLPQCRCRPYGCSDRRSLAAGARLFVDHLRSVNVVPPRADNGTETPPLLDAFRQWMRVNRNIGEATLYNYSLAVRDLLQAAGDDPSRFHAQGLRAFVLDRSRRCGLPKAKTMVTALRAFLRFLINAGLCPVGLDAAIPTLAHWHLSTLPRYLGAEEVERVVAASNPEAAMGIRDRAIVLLLARLALRASDIVHLGLDDIDWKEGWIRVRGKGRRDTRLPLTKEVGDAIVAYVRGVRPCVDTDTVFIRSRAPLRGFASHAAISVIVANAMRRAGVTCPVRGAAHVLRHSAATTMLRQGASLQDIAVVLRHRSIETTSIYAKVDVLALREIAQPWPEEVQLC